MSKVVGFRPDDAGLTALVNSPAVAAACVRDAAAFATEAKRVLPQGKTGTLKSSVHYVGARVGLRTRRGWKTRAGARVSIDAPYAGVVEARTHAIARLCAKARKTTRGVM